ncbi:MAG: pre-16S rRNA-processing nuclease YqgF [Symploca sp. SIO2D2]|nr:pre-16S rRNA-processing nuclease YqgF [Symploca sp. SIO2D2]NER21232.1 pre-16S rRNA-processing nuclease YqgF [Symploca sp. SIO1C2]NER46617.1 pre-16S rRNA-processing nuclease YqgF [Symploca sp. SIO1A3]
MILGFDPGRDKCGLAVIGQEQQLLYHQVVPSPQAIATIKELSQKFPLETIVMGNGTTAKNWQQEISRNIGGSLSIALVDERYSTLEARDRYWQMYPPQGLQRLIPQGMRQPPRPVDDLVAIILVERYLKLEKK